MGISQFPPATSGGGLSNDFILDRANTNNTTFALPREFEAGGYALVTNTNDSTFDVYLLNAAGSSVGYTNSSAIVASEAFDTVVVYGLSTAATMQFAYRGPSTNATSTGTETGASPFLTSIFPADLPNVDDTATVAGGNFASNVAITFESGTVVLPAKNVVVGSSTALVVTRPDNLIQDNSPYNLRAVNPGVTQPTGSNANLLTGTVTAGADPTFITTSPILGAGTGVAFSSAIQVSDSDGTVINWQITAGTLPSGLTLATATGVISGTPTVEGNYTFTVRITDDGQNTNTRQFEMPVGFSLAGGNGTVVGGTTYRWFTTSGSLQVVNGINKSAQYIVIAGGGGGGAGTNRSSGGGGAGGLVFGSAIFTSGTHTVTIGAGGASQAVGSNSLIASFATATGGGDGGNANDSGAPEAGTNGGSGGGAGRGSSGTAIGGTGIAGQGNNGGSSSGIAAGGGGGAGQAGTTAKGGDGLNTYSAWASAINIIYNAGYFAGGGAARDSGGLGTAGLGGGGGGLGGAGSANSGGGGASNEAAGGGTGGSGLVIVRYS